MSRLFGTDGVRGVANRDLTPELLLKLGRAAALALGGGGTRVVIGRDTRLSGDLLQSALEAGLIAAGAEVLRVGVVPTAAVSWLTGELGAQAGAMISASHNPVPDNGVKFFGPDGYKLPDELEDRIEGLMDAGSAGPVGVGIRPVREAPRAVDLYRDHLEKSMEVKPAGLKVVADLAHGSATALAADLFTELGLRVTILNGEPDGARINVDCGSTHPEGLQAAVVREGADLGLAFDGDADRLIAVDEKGRVVDGDHLLYILGGWLGQRGELPGAIVVATVMSNLGLRKALAARGITVHETAVGDRQVLAGMLETGAALGGEQSGHLILLRHARTGDGLLTALRLLEALTDIGRPLSELRDEMPKYPQVLLNVPVHRKEGWETERSILDSIRRAEEELGTTGRIFVRPSGTERLIRVMVEGPEENRIRDLAEEVASTIETALGRRL